MAQITDSLPYLFSYTQNPEINLDAYFEDTSQMIRFTEKTDNRVVRVRELDEYELPNGRQHLVTFSSAVSALVALRFDIADGFDNFDSVTCVEPIMDECSDINDPEKVLSWIIHIFKDRFDAK